jgi:hypothetical protein
MTLQQILHQLEPWRMHLAAAMLALPVFTWISGYLVRAASPQACRWYLALPLYLVTVPGVCLLLTVVYLMLFTGANLFAELDVVLYFGPVLCMAVTLAAIRNLMPFDRIRGFDRLSGLILLVAISFGIVFMLSRLRFIIGFFGSFKMLVVCFFVIFLLLKLGARRMAGKKT